MVLVIQILPPFNAFSCVPEGNRPIMLSIALTKRNAENGKYWKPPSGYESTIKYFAKGGKSYASYGIACTGSPSQERSLTARHLNRDICSVQLKS